MRRTAQLAVVALLFVVAGCATSQPANDATTPPPSADPVSAQAAADDLRASLLRDEPRVVVEAVTQVFTDGGENYAAIDSLDTPADAIVQFVATDGSSLGLGTVFNQGTRRSFIEVTRSNRPIAAGDLVVYFPADEGVTLEPR
jgi:hypothetical protein